MKNVLLVILTILFPILTLTFLSSCRNNQKQEISPAKAAYSCPMHPEVKSDKPGTCPKCGMALEKQVKKNMKEVYSCPMHPEVTSDKPGTCSKCGMELEIKQEKSVYLCPGQCDYICNSPGNCPNCNKTLVQKTNVENSLSGNYIHRHKQQLSRKS